MSGQPTVIYSAANTQQAYLLKGLLEEQGIAAWVVNDSIQIAGGDLPLGWAAAARVVVGENDAIEARRLAEAFDRTTAHEPSNVEGGDIGDATAEWMDWPGCPQCQERRSARCPVCGVSGTSFPLADIQDTETGPRVFLVCAGCDDHFLPEWYRLCPRCGYDYGDGVEIEPPTARVDSSSRSWIVVLLMIGCSLALAAYFCWLFGWRPV